MELTVGQSMVCMGTAIRKAIFVHTSKNLRKAAVLSIPHIVLLEVWMNLKWMRINWRIYYLYRYSHINTHCNLWRHTFYILSLWFSTKQTKVDESKSRQIIQLFHYILLQYSYKKPFISYSTWYCFCWSISSEQCYWCPGRTLCFQDCVGSVWLV